MSRWGGLGAAVVSRKSVTKTDPGLKAALLALVEPESRGEPQSVLRWTTNSLRRGSGACHVGSVG